MYMCAHMPVRLPEWKARARFVESSSSIRRSRPQCFMIRVLAIVVGPSTLRNEKSPFNRFIMVHRPSIGIIRGYGIYYPNFRVMCFLQVPILSPREAYTAAQAKARCVPGCSFVRVPGWLSSSLMVV